MNQSYLQDENGNIFQRQDNNAGLTESFGYDADNRLTCTALSSTCSTATVTYDSGAAGPGNITSQSGVGTYVYPNPEQVRPHAVTSLTGTFNGIVNPTFAYDANGNMTNRASSTQNVYWYSSNYPSSISAIDATGSEEVQFNYGPDRQRWKVTYTGPGGTGFTYYIGGLVDLVFINGVANYRHYIYAGTEPAAVYYRTAAAGNSMSYILEDHQGSLSAIASSIGTAQVDESFSAFGQRRSPISWSGSPSNADLNNIAALTSQGYTFQTWLGQSMGLNHMNGRVQDATLGRFLSPGPYNPNPTNAQSYNRYTYVNNNPVTGIDPSGFDDCQHSLKCSSGDSGGSGGDAEDQLPEQVVISTNPSNSTLSTNITLVNGQLSIDGAIAGASTAFNLSPALTSVTQMAIPSDGSPDQINGVEVDAAAIHLGGGFDYSSIYQPLSLATSGLAQGHAYSTRNQICQRPLTAPEMSDLIRRFTVPNVYLQGQPLGAGIHMVAAWGIPGGFVTTTFSADGLTGFNQTTPFHIFTGTVVRSVDNTATSADMVTYGYGGYPPGLPTSPNSSSVTTSSVDIGAILDQINNVTGPIVFNAVDQQAARFAQNHYSGC